MEGRSIAACTAGILPLLIWSAAATASTPFFMGLGDLPGGPFSSTAAAVSADGSIVVGSSVIATVGNPHRPDSLEAAFRWTAETGKVGLGDLAGGPVDSGAGGVSADGSVVVGSSAVDVLAGREPPFQTLYRAFRWTLGQGMVNLGRLQNSHTTSFASDVSADGSVIVGMSGVHPIRQVARGEAFRWRQGSGMVGLGELPGYDYSDASGVSADGSVVVGRSWSGANQSTSSEAFHWRPGAGMVSLGDLPGGQLNSHAVGVSADGSVIVGRGSSDAGSEAFRWTQASGMVGLGDLPGGDFLSIANGVSADGSIAVGQGRSESGNEAFIWDPTHGMRSLRSILANNFGLSTELAGWTLTSANDISADGQFIVGSGTNPNGNSEAWLARLDSAPALPGDFNNDGTVDAADYVIWRTTDGTQAGHDVWRAHFGQAAVGGISAGVIAAVPEPIALTMFVVAMIAYSCANSRRRHNSCAGATCTTRTNSGKGVDSE
jgi:probable HAF family extracellular repeat protein